MSPPLRFLSRFEKIIGVYEIMQMASDFLMALIMVFLDRSLFDFSIRAPFGHLSRNVLPLRGDAQYYFQGKLYQICASSPIYLIFDW